METSNTFYDQLSKDEQSTAIIKDPNVVRYIRNQSDHIKLLAIYNGCLLKYIIDPTYEMQLEAIKINSINIIYIDNPSDYLLEIAVCCCATITIKQSLKTNNCEKSKAILEALENTQVYMMERKEEFEKKEKSNRNKGCTIS